MIIKSGSPVDDNDTALHPRRKKVRKQAMPKIDRSALSKQDKKRVEKLEKLASRGDTDAMAQLQAMEVLFCWCAALLSLSHSLPFAARRGQRCGEERRRR